MIKEENNNVQIIVEKHLFGECYLVNFLGKLYVFTTNRTYFFNENIFIKTMVQSDFLEKDTRLAAISLLEDFVLKYN